MDQRNIAFVIILGLVILCSVIGHREGAKLRIIGVRGLDVFNIDFGPTAQQPSTKTGPAAVGEEGDFWNSIAVGFNDDHTESQLRSAKGRSSPIQVRMVNLGGGWSNSGKMGVQDPMFNTFDYPQNNQGGNSQVILKNVPAGIYDLYLYGHGTDPLYYGDYTITAGQRNYGRKATSNQMDAVTNTRWVEGSQYVKFTQVQVHPGEDIDILIQPGGEVTDDGMRHFSDAMICGLQLIPIAS